METSVLIESGKIDQSTVNAYLETDYCVAAPSPFVLRVGIASECLAKLHKQFRASCSAFVTACNPRSQGVGEIVNAQRQEDLANELNRRSLTCFDGIGMQPAGNWNWPGEPSYLVLGLSLEVAKELGNKYDQNAIIWCGSDAIPELVLLR